jgi:hypothetical protein
MSAVVILLVGLVVAAGAGIWSRWYHKNAADDLWADEAVAFFQAMRSVDGLPTTDKTMSDHADEALALVADELEQRRLARCVRDHPAGKGR